MILKMIKNVWLLLHLRKNKAVTISSVSYTHLDVYKRQNMDLEKHVDVIRKYNDGNVYSAFIIENQSYVDMSMVVRLSLIHI